MTGSVNSAQTKQSPHEFASDSAHHLTQSSGTASPDLLDSWRARSKSLSDMGQNLLKQLAKNSVSRLSEIPAANSVINMTTNNQTLSTSDSGSTTPNRANQLFRQQLPGITKQILGKRFNTINKLANLVMPAGSFDKASDQVLELLADFASTVSGIDHIVDEAGVKTLADLQGDTARSGRLARALNEKNRYIGMAQGAVSGATGVGGAAADIPLSMILALRAVYLTGRAYGFELNQPEDRAMIFEALSNADLSLITEKQAILIGLNSVSGMLGTGNIQGLQTMLGSSNDFEPLFKLLSDSNGQLKWRISSALLNKVTPVIGGAVGAIYTSRLLKEVSDSAKQVFEHARQQNGSTQQVAHNATPSATEQQPQRIEDKLANTTKPANKEAQAAQKEAQEVLLHNDDIAKVEVSTRREHDAQQVDDATKDEQIHDKLAALADDMIEDADKQGSSAKNSTAKNSPEQLDSTKPARSRSTKAKSANGNEQDATDSAKNATSKSTQDKAGAKAEASKPARRASPKTGNTATNSAATADNAQAGVNTNTNQQ